MNALLPMFFLYFFLVIATLFAAWRAWRRLRYFLHVFQLEGYKTDEYAHWMGTRLRHMIFRRSHWIGAAVLVVMWLGMEYVSEFWFGLLGLIAWSITFASSRPYRGERQKKPLAYTARFRRLLAAAAVIALLPVLAGLYGALDAESRYGLLCWLGGWYASDLGAPLWVWLAGLLTKPVERSIQNGFKRQARARLAARRNLTVIGITGSYGKTSVKFAVAEILRQRLNALPTPSSYNTPMGICLVVNQKLGPEHQALVLEMGMRRRGDIRELCEIAAPDIAIVTSVGKAHLETMGSIENIALEKSDILRYMKPDGVAVLNVDDPRVAEMATLAPGRVWRVSAAGHEADVSARDIRYGPDGATFLVRDDTGAEQLFRTKLLGEHNVVNILLGIAVGRQMGLRLRQMAHAVSRLEPVEHRLQLRKDGDVTIIDDAFNSNPVGARNAVEILGQFNSGRRVIVTPGMVELGEAHWEENRRFGEHIARHADLAVLVGPEQTRPIQEGLRTAAFPEDRLRVVPSLFAAQDFLRTYLRPGDVVLYENDLPDQYDE